MIPIIEEDSLSVLSGKGNTDIIREMGFGPSSQSDSTNRGWGNGKQRARLDGKLVSFVKFLEQKVPRNSVAVTVVVRIRSISRTYPCRDARDVELRLFIVILLEYVYENRRIYLSPGVYPPESASQWAIIREQRDTAVVAGGLISILFAPRYCYSNAIVLRSQRDGDKLPEAMIDRHERAKFQPQKSNLERGSEKIIKRKDKVRGRSKKCGTTEEGRQEHALEFPNVRLALYQNIVAGRREQPHEECNGNGKRLRMREHVSLLVASSMTTRLRLFTTTHEASNKHGRT
ncbi:LOW QUALITY PROTEIN: hypothetical protein V1478_015933 [Vespula squamosa]|uniref:Uncharacterized protein n=1 Tax=Vespula squamosa TaxID=30214 RepID=A0ABD2A2C3_VESSQ